MRLFQWDGQYDVFSPQLDAEHRELLRLGADLHKAVVAKASTPRISELARALADEVEVHFSHEERIMRGIGYQAYEWHKSQHDGMRRKLKRFSARIEVGERKAADELLEYFAQWLRGHTGVCDRMMSASLRAHERQHPDTT